MHIFNSFFRDNKKKGKPSYYKYLLFYLSVIFILTVVFYCLGVFDYEPPIPEVRYHFLEKKSDAVYGDDYDYKNLPPKMQPNTKKVNLDIKNVILENEPISNKNYVPDVIKNLYNGKVPKNIKELYGIPKNKNLFSKINTKKIFEVPKYNTDFELQNNDFEPSFDKIPNVKPLPIPPVENTVKEVEPLIRNVNIYDEVMDNISKMKVPETQIDDINFTI